MDIGLDGVIEVSYSIRESVKNIDTLLKLTRKQDAFRMRWTDWGKIRKLYVLGSSDFREIDELRDSRLKPGYYLDRETETELLVIGASAERIQEHLSRCGDNLETLSLHFTTMEELNLAHMTGLEVLDLSKNENLRRIIGMDRLTQLRRLKLGSTRLGPVLDLNPYPGLVIINISGTPIQEIRLDHPLENVSLFYAERTALCDVSFLSMFPGIRNLSLMDSAVTQLPSLEKINKLEHMNLIRTKIRALPQLERLTNLENLWIGKIPMESMEQLQFPKRVKWIVLDGSPIQRLPSGLRGLKSLVKLELANLQLEELPDWFPELLQRDMNLYLGGTTVRGMEAGFLQQPKEVILQWFEERKKARSAPAEPAGAPLNEVKVVFLGDGEAGKSHTVARLLNEGGEPKDFSGDSTPGIVITDKSYDIGDRHVQVHFWDFGGQEILHSMHRMFLTERTLYIILINARDDTQDDRARYWLHNVKSFAGSAPVLLVLNKMDQNPNASVNESDLRAIYPNLTEVVKLSAMFDSREKFNEGFTEAMKRQIGNMKNLDFFFPHAWTKAKQRLLGMKENYIRGGDYAAICDESGITDEGDLRRSLLNWFNDLGVSICYGGSARLRDYVILRPNWITNAVYAILFNKHPDTRNGIISHDAIFEMIQPPKEGDDPYRRTNSTESYTDVEIDYILGVTRKFRLSFRVDDEREFIPMLCGRESLPIAGTYSSDPDTLEFRMIFDYLPSNVLHRLMVELRQDLDTVQVWRTGAHFVQKSSGLSAVVTSDGRERNVLKLYVRSGGKIHSANTYLCILKDTIDQIARDMNLEPPANEVVYKLDGKRQAFDYDALLEVQAQGQSTWYSRTHRRSLLIDDILNQTGRRPEEERERLFENILKICQQLQADRNYWNVKEDVRNTYLRNSLRNMGYQVADQTFSGVSGSGRSAGELDMEIRKDANTPWTICEALNIKSRSRTDWNFHLQKLLDNYNPSGLPFLFLVSYVEGGADQFDGIWRMFADHVRQHSPDRYELRSWQPHPVAFGSAEQIHYIQAVRCTYDRAGFPTTVYHIFVRMGA